VGLLFLSYRQDDTGTGAPLLRDKLSEAFGEDHVFFAADTLGPGTWWEQIEAALRSADVVLVLIGRRWLSVTDAEGRPRLPQADDVHRREIEIALASSAAVIPVLVNNAVMPARKDLPPSIAALADLQAQQLSEAHRHRVADLERLIGDIEKAGIPRIAPPEKPVPWRRLVRLTGMVLRLLIVTFVISVVLLVAAFIVLGWTFPPEQVSALTLAIFVSLIALSRLHTRFRRRVPYAKD
jgi:hypothetical protein